MANKWIQAGYLPAIPLPEEDETPVENQTQLLELLEEYLLKMFQEEIDPEVSEEENLEELTDTARIMLQTLQSNGLANWSDPKEIALEAMGKKKGAIWEMLEDEALQNKIMMWLTWKDETFPLNPKTWDEAEEYIRTDPTSWAETIAQEW